MKMDRQMQKEVSKLVAEANRISDALYTALEGDARRDEMTEAVSEEMERIEDTEDHPVIRADFKVRALRGIASDFNVAI